MQERAKATEVKDQVHAVWCDLSHLYMEHWQLTIHSGFVSLRTYLARYWNWNRCSSMSNIAGMVRSLDSTHSSLWLTRAVPIVAIFTKFDDLITQVYDRKKEDNENRKVACATLEQKFKEPLKGYNFPPRAYVQFECLSLLL